MKLNLKTALSGPLLELERTLLQKSDIIEHWFRQQWQQHQPPFYSSCDLRNSGFKITPVDTNLFPGGFNNISCQFLPLCMQAVQVAVEKYCPTANSILLIPENHTRNQFYLQNISQLSNIFRLAGFEIRIGTLNPEITETTTLNLENGANLVLEPIFYDEISQTIKIKSDTNFEACCIILNNDLSVGIPKVLQQLQNSDNGSKQIILPPTNAGWTTRRKSKHFQAYDSVVQNFANHIGIDGWRINPAFGACKVNFHERQGEECLTHNVGVVLERIKQKYKEYDINEKPYVVVKADAGTYGMGIMTISDASEIVGLNRKQRNKMSVIKEGLEVTEVIIQEGVHTIETINDFAAEPVVYMVDKFIIGGFYRVNDKKGKNENLNSAGMFFEPFAFAEHKNNKCDTEIPNRFYSYGVIARLAALAASIELE